MQFRYDCTIMRSAMQVNLYACNPYAPGFDFERESREFHVIQHANKHAGLHFDSDGNMYASRKGWTYA